MSEKPEDKYNDKELTRIFKDITLSLEKNFNMTEKLFKTVHGIESSEVDNLHKKIETLEKWNRQALDNTEENAHDIKDLSKQVEKLEKKSCMQIETILTKEQLKGLLDMLNLAEDNHDK